MTQESYNFWDIILKAVGGFGLLLTLAWAPTAFYLTKKNETDLAIWNRKVEVYSNLARLASALSTFGARPTPDQKEDHEARALLWQARHDELEAVLGRI